MDRHPTGQNKCRGPETGYFPIWKDGPLQNQHQVSLLRLLTFIVGLKSASFLCRAVQNEG